MQQRLVQENAPLGGKRPIFLAKDPPHCPLTLGTVGGSPTPGNHTAETRTGWLPSKDSNLSASISNRSARNAGQPAVPTRLADRPLIKEAIETK
jgi:hypothetical protein